LRNILIVFGTKMTRQGEPAMNNRIYAVIFVFGLFFSAFAGDSAPQKKTFDFIKGHTLILPALTPDTLSQLKDSMQKLAQTGSNYVCLAVMADMEVFNKPDIKWGAECGFPDSMLLQAIQIARDNQLKIVLKPMVNCKDGTWRSWIKFTDSKGDQDLAAWGVWWDEYQAFILHYAAIAQQTQCEMYCLGCEMGNTEEFETKWRYLIQQARDQYKGVLTYNVNHDHYDSLRFWDDLDVISVSAYFWLGQYMEDAGIRGAKDPYTVVGIEELRIVWKIIRGKLAVVSAKFNKPIFFIETGACNAKGVARTPWEHANPKMIYDGQEQAIFYQSVMETFWDEPWFMGVTWWDWPAALYSKEEAKKNISFAIYGKPAEDVVKTWYSKPREGVTVGKAK
jgi:hypothetical protein